MKLRNKNLPVIARVCGAVPLPIRALGSKWPSPSPKKQPQKVQFDPPVSSRFLSPFSVCFAAALFLSPFFPFQSSVPCCHTVICLLSAACPVRRYFPIFRSLPPLLLFYFSPSLFSCFHHFKRPKLLLLISTFIQTTSNPSIFAIIRTPSRVDYLYKPK